METSEERRNRLDRESEQKRDARLQRRQETAERRHEIAEERQERAEETNVRPKVAQMISEDEHRMLQNFRKKMDNIRYSSCPICNE